MVQLEAYDLGMLYWFTRWRSPWLNESLMAVTHLGDLVVQHAVFGKSRDANGRLLKVAEGVVNWTLPGHTPAPISMTPVATASKPEPQVCKKTARVGSLASFEHVCMTPTEWAKQSDEVKQPISDSQGKGFSVCAKPTRDGGLAAQPGGVTVASAPGC